ncbi:hypothetical protein [Streptomyces sp. NBC_00233]|uniref:hypothetical protein n=1 Tax=Streptomyces sp. NBC_00233 TaxID=2975686 RepID=UPI002255E2E8|nr:hypothetical protein [Streptomyces sp. NBC_00233]MCX5233444.1 hypothetical protein [Streptomyces sp. NBC_00233]
MRTTDKLSGRVADRTRAHHALVHDLLGQGMGLQETARHLDRSRRTVQQYTRATH